MPDENELLEVIADYLRKKGFNNVENSCGSLYYERDGKVGTVYVDVMEKEADEQE